MADDKIHEIKPGVSWIGVLDRDIISFDIVMETQYGTTYNSYYIDADKKTVIDTVKDKFRETFLNKLSKLTDPSEIEYIICSHSEPDHSGNIGTLLELAPNATVIGSGQAIKNLQEIMGFTFKSQKVQDGDVIDLGNKKLRIISAPNLHWPDTIFTYLEEDKLLFTCDSFGAHLCDEAMFNDKITGNFDDAFKYYFDVILKPFSKFMLKAIEKIRDLEIYAICTGHGPILRYDWIKYVNLAKKMSTDYMNIILNAQNRVLLTYVSAYGYTKEMAYRISEGLRESGQIEVDLVDIENISPSEMEEKLIKSDALIIGSPTFNQNTLLPVYKLFSVINPIRDKGKLAAAFGSYGWSGEAVKIIEDHLKNLKLDVSINGLSEKFYPNNDKNDRLIEFGRAFAEKLLQKKLSI